jgi:hypothetical protein
MHNYQKKFGGILNADPFYSLPYHAGNCPAIMRITTTQTAMDSENACLY